MRENNIFFTGGLSNQSCNRQGETPIATINHFIPQSFIRMALWVAMMCICMMGMGQGQKETQTFDNPGTHIFIVPAGVSTIIVEAWGAGGGGATRTSNGQGGGGGGGAYARSIISVTPGNSYSVVVGAGGAANSNGGPSRFGNTLVVAAGGIGAVGNSSNGAAGGSIANSTGDVRFAGGNGAEGYSHWLNTNYSGGGGGGAGSTANGNSASGISGGGGAYELGGAGGNGVTGSSNGNSGSNYGGGGSGGARRVFWGGDSYLGGNGANGLVRVTAVYTFYYQEGAPHLTTSWDTELNGGGIHPANFSSENQQFVVPSNRSFTTTANWTISGQQTSLVIEDGAGITANHTVTLSGHTRFEVKNGGTYHHNVNNLTIWNAGEVILESNSTVEYARSGNQTISPQSYGNLHISNSGTKSLTGHTNVAGNLMVSGSAYLNTNQHTLAGNPTGQFVLGDGNRLYVGSGSHAISVPFPTGFTTANINLHPNSRVYYRADTDQTISGAPSGYGHLHVSGDHTKTLQDNIRVHAGLNLDGAILALGSDTLTLAAGTMIEGSEFTSTNMILCNGNGMLIREGTQASHFSTTYPVGTPGVYSPMHITAISAAVHELGHVAVRAVPGIAPNANPTDLQRHWITSSENLSDISANITFHFAPGELPGNNYEPAFHDYNNWLDLPGASMGATNFSTSGAANLDGVWTAKETVATYYSYQSGNWNSTDTWTTDPSGSLHEKPGIPGANDRVVILNGRTVSVTDNNTTVTSVQINQGGVLDAGLTSGHNFGEVWGQGMLRLRTRNFPGGDFSSFVAAQGGTVEYYDPTADFTFQQQEYNHLILNFSAVGRVATAQSNIVIEGDLTVQRGGFQINNNTAGSARTIDVAGNVLVESNGYIQVGTRNLHHRFIVGGNFTNNGVVRFTNLNSPNYTSTPNNGRADVVFNNIAADQQVQCNGQTDFYRIEIDKGDIARVLNIDASENTNFRLLGRNNYEQNTNNPGNISNPNALGLLSGTVRLGNNIVLPSMITEEVYYIDEDAVLWLDGATVTYSSVGNTDNGTALVVYGGLKVSGNSVFNDNSKQGIVMRSSATVQIEGGQVFTECVRTSYETGIHRGAFNMSGGELTIRAINLPNLTGMNVYASFTLPYPDNTMDISGGIINILSPNTIAGGFGTNFSVLIGANPHNISVTGGTFNITIPNNRNVFLLSTAPFWDLNFISQTINSSAQPRNYANNTTIPGMSAQPLQVLNNLTLTDRAILTSGNQNMDVLVGGNFTIGPNARYTPGTNTTIFNGENTQEFANQGTVTNGLNHLELAHKSNLGIANDLIVRGQFTTAEPAIFRDNGRVIQVQGNIHHQGIHYKPATGAGSIRLTGNAAQTIGGEGVFNNLVINKNGGGVSVISNIEITGDLRMVSAHRLFLGNNMLKMGPEAHIFSSLSGQEQTFNFTRMIVTNGLGSDGGIKKEFADTQPFLFPYGYQAANNNFYYLPSQVTFNQVPGSWGSVRSRPVNDRHHLAQGANNSLRVFWKNQGYGFEGIPEGSVLQRFTYDNYFADGNQNEYRPAVYRSGTTWQVLNDVNLVNQATNVITFNNQTQPTGEYTAGQLSAFENIPILYSRQDGLWNDKDTWSATEVGGAPGGVLPGPNTIVVIGDEAHPHTVLMDQNNQSCGALFIAASSTLDLQSTNGHTFAALPEEVVTGAGTLRISRSGYFPAGDFGDFIGPDGGTVEYYATTANIALPQNSESGLVLNQYRNLVLNHGNRIITLPNQNLTIHGDLVFEGVSGSNIYNRTNNNNGWTEIIVKGNILAQSGTFLFWQGNSKLMKVFGDLIISENASFEVNNANTSNHIIEFYGNVINDGVLNLYKGANRRVSSHFKGEKNTVISGSGNTFHLFDIIVDKGHNATPVVSLESEITTGVSNPFLTLLNGTFRVNNEQLTVTITNHQSDFTIPSTAALSVEAGEVRVGYGNGNANLQQAGTLEIIGGAMYIGDPSRNSHNSIEYAAAGQPRIVVSGGELHVNGQIRRSTSTTSGSLNYVQNGGTVSIYGKGRLASRGLLEIANQGSLFSMSGGEIYFDRPSAAGTAFGDLYLRPHSHSITGGTLQLGLSGSDPDFGYRLSTSAPLYNLHIGSQNRHQLVENEVFDLQINNNLLIAGNSQFRANGYDVVIMGNLTNENGDASAGINTGGYRPGTLTQTTTFAGGVNGRIAGVPNNRTNFAHLVIAKAGNRSVILQPNSHIRVNNGLYLNSGVINDGGNNIALAGDLYNSATHHSHGSEGGIRLEGSQVQSISGDNGQFGNLILDNSHGAQLKDNSTINGRLTFLQGSLYIDDYLLTLGHNASIGGTPDLNRMIILNGALSDQGVRKNFGAGASTEFLIPLGVSGKYTPASYQVHSNPDAGYIVVKPVNRRHPSVDDDQENELAYYWNVSSAGMGNADMIHTYHYMLSDVKPSGNSDQQYVAAYFQTYDNQWENMGDEGKPGWVDENNRTIVVYGQGYVSGDITAGMEANFPESPMPIYYSRNDSPSTDWSEPRNWSTEGHDGDEAAYPPYGHAVIIKEGHTRTLDKNSQFASWVQVNGTLDCGTTTFHNLNKVFGEGVIKLESSAEGFFVFPGGNFDEFLQTPGTTVEFTGSNTATLPLKPGNIYKPYQNVVFSGSGQKNMSAEHMRILGSMTLKSGTTLNNTLHHRNLYIEGDWINENTSQNSFVPGTGTVFFSGSATQHLNVEVMERFYNLTMNHTGEGVSLENSQAGIEITRRLTLTRGVLFSYQGREVSLFNTSASVAASGGSNSSFVDGPLRKRIIRGQSFSFPVGSYQGGAGRLGRVELRNTNANATPAWWTTQYVSQSPADHYPGDLQEPLTDISDNEFWVIDAPAGGTTNVRLRWDERSFPHITSDPHLRPNMRVVEYQDQDGALWRQRGNVVSGNPGAGTVSTSTPVSGSVYSLGVIGVTAGFDHTDPVTICDNDAIAQIPVSLTGTPPWSITYQTTGNGNTTTYSQNNISASPYMINLSGEDMGGFDHAPYTLSLTSVNDAFSPGVVNTATVQIALELTHKPDIEGSISVGLNETRVYSTTHNPGSMYQWQWIGNSGGTITSPVLHSTQIAFSQGTGSYTLLLEETSETGCIATDEINIVVSNIPVPGILPLTPNICIIDEPVTYSTTYNDGNEYYWEVQGGDCTGCGIWSINNAVTVSWDQVGNGRISVQERIGANGPIGDDQQDLLISAMPQQRTVSAELDLICQGGQTSIEIANSEPGISYQLRHGTTPIGSAVAGNNNTVQLPTGVLNTNRTFNVLAYNLGCEMALAQNPDVTVQPASVSLTSTHDVVNNIACPGSEVSFSAESQNSLGIIWAAFYKNAELMQNTIQPVFTTDDLAHNDQISLVATVQGNCQVPASNSAQMIVGEGYWTGEISNDWNNPDNWPCDHIPDNTTDVVLTNHASNPTPRISDTQAYVNHLTIHDQAGIMLENSTLNIYGNLTQDGNFLSDSQGVIAFRGNAVQEISGSVSLAFHGIHMDKTGAAGYLNLLQDVEVLHQLILDQGRIHTTPTARLIMGATATATEGNHTSFVNGPMRKKGTANFVFPTGKDNRLGRIGIHDIESAKSDVVFEAEYFPHASGASDNNIFESGLVNISQREYWRLTNPSGNVIQAQISLHWADAGFSAIQHPQAVRVVQFRDGMWRNHGPTSDNPNGDYVVSSSPFTTFNEFTFGSSSGNNPFPIELLYFTARADGDHVSLLWATATEINNDYFTIERSQCGRHFEPIVHLPSKAPHGHSNMQLLYDYQDHSPLEGTSYYRLKQTDYDGTWEYSQVVAVDMQKQRDIQLQLYPNPNRGDHFHVVADVQQPGAPVRITISNLYGKFVYGQVLEADSNGMLHAQLYPTLTSGVYLVQVAGSGFAQTLRMVVR